MGNKQNKLAPKDVEQLSKECNFSADEIQEWYQEYKTRVTKTRNNSLTVDEFKTVYGDIFQGDATTFAENVFRTYDTDGNGKVSFREFIIGLNMTAAGDVSKKAKWAFDMYDVDGNGSISREEMKHIISAWFRMTVCLPGSDKDSPEKLTEIYFSKLDTDKDGQISWSEFVEGVKNDDFLVSLLHCNPDM